MRGLRNLSIQKSESWLCCVVSSGVLQKHKWEDAMTVDKKSWGYRRNTTLSDFLTMDNLTSILASAVRLDKKINLSHLLYNNSKYSLLQSFYTDCPVFVLFSLLFLGDFSKSYRVTCKCIFTKDRILWNWQGTTLTAKFVSTFGR